MGVTKLVGPEEARSLHESGVADLGENRVQDALRKMDALTGLPVRWHMIGHLQTNKVSKAVGRFDLIQSVDSLRLARSIAETARRKELVAEILLQVNVSGEGTKSGFAPEELAPALWADFHRLIAHMLPTFKPHAAILTLVLIQWHISNLHRTLPTTYYIANRLLVQAK